MISDGILAPMRQPDILDCIANLSSDEVFTPPALANQVLDLLPSSTWSDPDIKILDPCSKSGVFLREAAKRLMTGLSESFPDEGVRREHIFKNMLFGIAITELTAQVLDANGNPAKAARTVCARHRLACARTEGQT